MLAFPFIESIEVDGYGLYPGPSGNMNLSSGFGSGPWIILGVNGIGKSTLLMMFRYLLTGNTRSVEPGFRGPKSEIVMGNKWMFGDRVADSASDATAVMVCKFGKRRLQISRNLSDLSLIEAKDWYGAKHTEI